MENNNQSVEVGKRGGGGTYYVKVMATFSKAPLPPCVEQCVAAVKIGGLYDGQVRNPTSCRLTLPSGYRGRCWAGCVLIHRRFVVYDPTVQVAYKKMVALICRTEMRKAGLFTPLEGPLSLSFEACFPHPKSARIGVSTKTASRT